MFKKIKAYYDSGDYIAPNIKIEDCKSDTGLKNPVGYINNEENADELVARWNREHPIGTRIKSTAYDEILTTRSKAVVLFGHRAAVYVENYNGYFDLKEIRAISDR